MMYRRIRTNLCEICNAIVEHVQTRDIVLLDISWPKLPHRRCAVVPRVHGLVGQMKPKRLAGVALRDTINGVRREEVCVVEIGSSTGDCGAMVQPHVGLATIATSGRFTVHVPGVVVNTSTESVSAFKKILDYNINTIIESERDVRAL